MNESDFKLILADDVEEVVVEGEGLRSMATNEFVWKDQDLVTQMESAWGKSDRSSQRSPSTGGKSHQFGGHDVLQFTVELIFALGSAGVIKHGFATLQSWLQQKKGRRVHLEVKDKGGKAQKIDISGYSEDEVRRILEEHRKGQ
jgi:hypothetical protein